MLCPNCKKEIPEGVQSCPECGASFNLPAKKQKKPITKKWWFWLIIVVAVIAVISSIGGGDDATSTGDETTTQSADAENTTAETTVATTSEISEDVYKSSCESIAYKDIARLPDNYKGKDVVFTGEVIQVMESSWSNEVTYRINVTKDEYGYWDDTVYVTYELPEGAPRILEDDIVTFYGTCEGTYTYESVLGSSVTIPSVMALYIDIQ